MKVLITGATSGIGLQLTTDYLHAGHQVICCGRNAQALASFSTRFPEQSQALCFDIQDYGATVQAFKGLAGLDLVILNAGTCEYLDMPHFDARAFARVVQTNLIGAGNCLEMLIPAIRAGGRLALVGSSAAFVPLPRAEAYGASKAALRYLAETLAISLQRQGIAVSYIAPGFVKTPLTDRNDFPMPMRVEVKTASAAIIRGLERGRSEIHFPLAFTGLLKLIGVLPGCVGRFIIARTLQRTPG